MYQLYTIEVNKLIIIMLKPVEESHLYQRCFFLHLFNHYLSLPILKCILTYVANNTIRWINISEYAICDEYCDVVAQMVDPPSLPLNFRIK